MHAIASEYAFPTFLGWGDPIYGWAEAEAGDLEQGIRRIEQGLDTNRQIGTGLMRPEHLGLLASLFARRGSVDLALTTLDEAITTAQSTGETYCLPELLRLKAELMLQRSAGHAPESERLLWKSVEIARQIQARSFELRSVMSLGRLLGDAGRKADARELISGVYRQFSEGSDTRDLRDASHLLSSLT